MLERIVESTQGRKAGRKQDFTQQDGWLTRTAWLSRTIYWGIHACCLFVFAVGAPRSLKRHPLKRLDSGDSWNYDAFPASGWLARRVQTSLPSAERLGWAENK